MWQLEAASRASLNNGMEEGLGDSSEVPPIEFPRELHMEIDRQPVQATTNVPVTARSREDQMVPTMTASLNRAEAEVYADLGNGEDSRAEVPSQAHFGPRAEREETIQNTGDNAFATNGVHQPNIFEQPQHRCSCSISIRGFE
jgi:cryptochrome 1